MSDRNWYLCKDCAKKHYVYFVGITYYDDDKKPIVCSDCGKPGEVVKVKMYFDFIEKHNRDLETIK